MSTYKIFMLILLMVLFTDCGREYNIQGFVIYLENVKESKIEQVMTLPKDLQGRILSSVKVEMIFELDKNGNPVDETKWIMESITDENGYFEMGAFAAPGKKNLVGLRICKEGYKTSYINYWDYFNTTEYFLITLAKEI
jgi:hypothetical protein